ncbi:MAG TPA: hypothetical protein VL549_14380 [Gemmatimonadales bacterium]|jgi:hypothetical protein|nr:hypothetical protein [Gemmatimonadales bacterium]
MGVRLLLLGALLAVARLGSPAGPAAVPVHWSEGTLHGFLELHTAGGALIAEGDLLQVARDSDLESRLVFHFSDGSLFRETVTFTQHGVFRLKDYRLEQQGKAFEADLDVSLAASGAYDVRTTSHKDGKEQRYTGTLDLPADVYNGLIPIIGKNLDRQAGRTVHIVAFTPKPYVIPLAMVPSGEENKVVRFTLKPKLNLLQRVGAALKHQSPPDSYIWILTQDVPAFVRFQGPLYAGPVWRIDLTRPRWSGADN